MRKKYNGDKECLECAKIQRETEPVEEPKPEGAIEKFLNIFESSLNGADYGYIYTRKTEIAAARAEYAALIEERRALKERIAEAETIIKQAVFAKGVDHKDLEIMDEWLKKGEEG